MGSVGGRTREREITDWIGRLGAVEVGHVGRRWAVGRSVAYGLIARLVGAGLLERVQTLPGDPTLIKATDAGIRYAGLGLAAAKVAPAQVDHWISCADVALWAEKRWGRGSVASEREIRWQEREAQGPLASAVVGELPGGSPMLHRPDLAVTDNRSLIAVEVELTAKAPRRLEHLVRARRRTRQVERVIYVVPEGPTQRAIERAVRATHAEERVVVVDLESAR